MPKRKISQAQRDALAKGRAKLRKLRANGKGVKKKKGKGMKVGP